MKDNAPIKITIQNAFNKVLKKAWTFEDYQQGKEVELCNEWVVAIAQDASIFYDYEKLGWKVMQYQQQFSNGFIRQWVNFKNSNYKKRR